MADLTTEEKIRLNEELQNQGADNFNAPKTEIETGFEDEQTPEAVEYKPQEKQLEAGDLPKFKRRPKATIITTRDPITLKVEKILEEGVGDAFSRLSPIAKQEFKLRGEEAAIQITKLLQSTHIKIKKVLRLIIAWLRLLPGINKFFLEQEAKIKTDKIVALYNSNKKDS